jgi:hypothetical protein
MRLGGPQGQFGQVRKISPPPGFDPRTVQLLGSRYTDYASRPTPVIKRKLTDCGDAVLTNCNSDNKQIEGRKARAQYVQVLLPAAASILPCYKVRVQLRGIFLNTLFNDVEESDCGLL